ncbi:MAG: hypothetical protein ABFD98_16460 [Syntrophobacteraceae bacterium]|nr:hypothetical protein [Desulfobacteraceae bacterium]
MRTIQPSSRRIIGALYSRLLADDSETGGACFRNWHAGWELVHGRMEHKRTADRHTLGRRYGIQPERVQFAELLFAIETYYVHLMKMWAFAALSSAFGGEAPLPVESFGPDRFRNFLEDLSSEDTFRSLGVRNYSDGGVFGWFSAVLDKPELHLMQQETVRILRNLPERGKANDTLRLAYHELIPNSVRHATGAYYTPGWLAENVLEGLGYDGNAAETLERRLLDPTCGSGTFLVAALSRSIQSGRLQGMDATRILESVLANIAGFDIDPVAVLASKTNYLSMISDLLSEGAAIPSEGIRIPVFLCDSVLVPAPRAGTPPHKEEGEKAFVFRLGGESFSLPERFFRPRAWNRFVHDLVGKAIRDATPHSRFDGTPAERCVASRDNLPGGTAKLLHFLRDECRAGRIQPCTDMLQDLPEPLFSGRFDILAGNPPWVNWEYLPPAYRRAVEPLWPRLGLLAPGNGTERSFSKEDISALVTYAVCERYLKDGGRLGFLLPQSLFKSSLNGRGFRRFRLGTRGPDLRVFRVDDLTGIRPFEGTANRTAAVFIERGTSTEFPVSYRKWSFLDRRTSVDASLPWDEVRERVKIERLSAAPSNPLDRTSCWMTANPESVALLARLSGPCPYRSRTGVFTGGANGVFYLDILERRPDGFLLVRNVPERAKRRVPVREAVLEPEYVFPLLRGRDVESWKCTVSRAILCPHSVQTGMHAVDRSVLQSETPLTLAYLHAFREKLLERRGFAAWERRYLDEAFYACQRIGSYTFAPYKVVWRYICRSFLCCVVEPHPVCGGEMRPVIPHEKLMLLGFQDAEEAYYVCGVLSSTPVRFFVESRMIETQIGPHVISQLSLPVFDSLNVAHRRIAAECRAGHASRAEGDDAEARRRMDSLDDLMAEILSITVDEIRALQRSSSGMPLP